MPIEKTRAIKLQVQHNPKIQYKPTKKYAYLTPMKEPSLLHHPTGQIQICDDSMPNGSATFPININLKNQTFLSLLPRLQPYLLYNLSERALSRLEGLDFGLKWFVVASAIFLPNLGKLWCANT